MRPQQIPLAIVGMACRLPGADGLAEYWRLMADGRSAMVPIPSERLDADLYFDPRGGRGKTRSRLAGLVSHAPLVPAHEAIIEVARAALLGTRPATFARAGVYLAHSRGSPQTDDAVYAVMIERLAESLWDVDELAARGHAHVERLAAEVVQSTRAAYPDWQAQIAHGADASQAAGLLARALGFGGPAMAINAACASSLVAVAVAARELQLDRVDLALVAAGAYLKPDSLVAFSQTGALSPGCCRPLDASADGMAAGEGYAAVVLKRLDQSLADGNRVWAVLRGSGISSDGRTENLWTPRREGQREAIRRAYPDSPPLAEVGYIEAHATGTPLGDATELSALAEALPTPHSPVALGAVKANIGHTLETAALAGLIKAVLCLHHDAVPPQIGVDRPRAEADPRWFFLPATLTPWPQDGRERPRRAAVNAVGIGGLNAHVVVEAMEPEFNPVVRQTALTPDPSPGTIVAGGIGEARDVAVHAALTPGPSPAGGRGEAGNHGPSPTGGRGEAGNHGPLGVAVVGVGVLLPGACGLEAYWDLLLAGRDTDAPPSPERWTPTPGKHGIPARERNFADPLQFMLLEAVDQALADAGADGGRDARRRTGVIVGAPVYGEFHEQLQAAVRIPEFRRELTAALRHDGEGHAAGRIAAKAARLLARRFPALRDQSGSYSSSTLASRIARTFDFMGGAMTIDARGASAAAALALCCDLLRSGDCDVAVCAAGDRSLGPVALQRLAARGQLAAGQPRHPFDARAGGFIPAEAAGALVLKRLDDAQRDGDRIHAVVQGIGAARADTLDEAIRAALRAGLAEARIAPHDLAFLETAAAGLPEADRAEIEALGEVFAGRAAPLAIGSAAGVTGYADRAAGMLALVKAILALRQGRFPGCRGIVPCERLAETPCLGMPGDLTDLTQASGASAAGVTCHDLDGLAYHVVLEASVEQASS